jgi:hypothetical protein
MNRISNAKDLGRYRLVGGGVLAVTAALVVTSCGGGGGGGEEPTATAATIDSASMSSALGDITAFMPICNPAAASEPAKPLAAGGFNPVAKLQQARLAALVAPQKKHALALTSSKPADVLGSCGGRFGYGSDYSHASGVTTGTLVFTDYCTNDTVSGERTTVSGSISFVDTATPTATGPITTRLEANSSAGVTATVRNTSGTVVSSETVEFTGFVMAVGNPGGTPSAASPDRLTLTELKMTNNTTQKTYRQTDWTATSYGTANGGDQMSMSGRGYRSSGAYYDIATTTPIVFDASGDTVSGAFTFTGANSSTAVATLVPGGTLQASLTVNGTPVAGLPACKK